MNQLIAAIQSDPIGTTAAGLIILVILWGAIPFLQAYNRKG
jgi:hypothetical protein